MQISSMVTTVAFVALWIWVVLDCVRADHRFVRHGPRWCWLTFVVTLPVIGAVAWMLFGRPLIPVRRDPIRLAKTVGPEDTPEWLAFLARNN